SASASRAAKQWPFAAPATTESPLGNSAIALAVSDPGPPSRRNQRTDPSVFVRSTNTSVPPADETAAAAARMLPSKPPATASPPAASDAIASGSAFPRIGSASHGGGADGAGGGFAAEHAIASRTESARMPAVCRAAADFALSRHARTELLRPLQGESRQEAR